MGSSPQAVANPINDADPRYEQAATEAFNSSPCVKLALQMPNVDLLLIVAIYKAGFSEGCMYGIKEFRTSYERMMLSFAGGRGH